MENVSFIDFAPASIRKAAQGSCIRRDQLDVLELGSVLSYLAGVWLLPRGRWVAMPIVLEVAVKPLHGFLLL